MEKAVTYARKSYYTGNLPDNEVIAYQQNAMNEYAEKYNIQIKREFTDVNFSGVNVDRPSLQELLAYLKGNPDTDAVIFPSVDRLGRNNKDNIDVVREILDYVKRVIFVREGFCFETKNPEFVTYLFVLLTAQATSFRETHSLNIAGAKDTKRHKYKIFYGSSYSDTHEEKRTAYWSQLL